MPNDIRVALFSDNKNFESLVEKDGVQFYRKQILKFGTWRHPRDRNKTFEVTPEVAQQVVNNFMLGYPVEAPIVLTHTNDPRQKVGSVRQFEKTSEGLFGLFSVADAQMNKNIGNKEKAPGVSVWLDFDYKDKQTDKSVGAVVKHVALVNHPYIEGLSGFEAVSLSEDKEAEKFVPFTMSEKNSNDGGKDMPKLNEILKSLKEEHKVDVVQLQEDLKLLNAQIEKGELVKKADSPVISDELLKGIKTKLELSEDTSAEEAIKAMTEKLESVLKLSGDKTEIDKLKKENEAINLKLSDMEADKVIDALVAENKVLPAEKPGLKKLYSKDQAMFTELTSTRTASLVELAEKGFKSDEEPNQEDKEKEQAYIDKQAKLAEEEGLAPSRPKK